MCPSQEQEEFIVTRELKIPETSIIEAKWADIPECRMINQTVDTFVKNINDCEHSTVSWTLQTEILTGPVKTNGVFPVGPQTSSTMNQEENIFKQLTKTNVNWNETLGQWAVCRHPTKQQKHSIHSHKSCFINIVIILYSGGVTHITEGFYLWWRFTHYKILHQEKCLQGTFCHENTREMTLENMWYTWNRNLLSLSRRTSERNCSIYCRIRLCWQVRHRK